MKLSKLYMIKLIDEKDYEYEIVIFQLPSMNPFRKRKHRFNHAIKYIAVSEDESQIAFGQKEFITLAQVKDFFESGKIHQ